MFEAPQKKRRHHYVWRYYLGAWAPNDKIWCYRDGKIFNSNLMGIGQERDFYKLRHLKPSEIDMIRKCFVDHQVDGLKTVLNNWLEMLMFPFEKRELLEQHGLLNETVDDVLKSFEHNVLEDIHSTLESKAIKYIDLLRDGDCSFYDDEKAAIEFLFFICFQYFRTKSIRVGAIAALRDDPVIDYENTSHAIAVILATILSHNLYLRKDTYHMVMLTNSSSCPLISGDQPVINTYAYGKPPSEPAEKLEFYYPISPEVALLITEDVTRKENSIISEDEVHIYNEMIVDASESQIYSSSKKSLESLSSTTGRKDQ